MITLLFFKEWRLVGYLLGKPLSIWCVLGQLDFILWIQFSQVWVMLRR